MLQDIIAKAATLKAEKGGKKKTVAKKRRTRSAAKKS